jgi:tetratricopeptide (TPR) repeat protein
MGARVFVIGLLALSSFCPAQETHSHNPPEELGQVSFPISCQASVQSEFNRSVALLHSFAYRDAEQSFRNVAEHDPGCAIAYWGMAMTHFHPLWQPKLVPSEFTYAKQEITKAIEVGTSSKKELGYIKAAEVLFQGDLLLPFELRGAPYEQAMEYLASAYPKDTESQVFYALALLANAPPSDKTHAKQKHAAGILEPIFAVSPKHPGVAHYLIHAYDNAEMASLGLPAARSYSKIAPSAPHALHMPSHIFTRLGLWEDSIASNIAARDAALGPQNRDEKLHSMDYLVYAYLQLGRDDEAAQIVQQLKEMQPMSMDDFKVAYAATVIPIRSVVERERWAEAAKISIPSSLPPEVEAIAVWARGLGSARSGALDIASKSVDRLGQITSQLRTSGNSYWATQTDVLRGEVAAWQARAEHHDDLASQLMREAADLEDSVEKLPVTPGPILPAREQLGFLLLDQGQPETALREFQGALKEAPGRRASLQGVQRALAATGSKQ